MKLNEIGPNVTIHADPTSLALISKEMKGIVNKQLKLFEIKTFPDITDVQSKVKTLTLKRIQRSSRNSEFCDSYISFSFD